MALDDILLEAEEKMLKSVEHLQQELGGLRTGKASPSLVDHIQVDYYGAPTRLRDLADQITDPAMRWRFLEQVPSNRNVMLLLTP